MTRAKKRFGLTVVLALTVGSLSGCAYGCDAAASLFQVAGDSMEGSDHARLNAIPGDQVCIQHPLGLGDHHVINL
ncbi:hypothetical protein [Mycobacterium sp. Marseille-P9652]|uniref:hypothetical protein n=1 Tax=Mycobacterium sp. Marseille-P9652 TaxID=2654950 RepID=UPI0012E7594B|nr:hypothetical protein [Mycobacterium sp. Marseille-P9652]